MSQLFPFPLSLNPNCIICGEVAWNLQKIRARSVFLNQIKGEKQRALDLSKNKIKHFLAAIIE
jgi:hypothetical protein